MKLEYQQTYLENVWCINTVVNQLSKSTCLQGLMNSWLKSPESSPPALPDELTLRGQGFGATKKRWLRQAISEECDSPNSRPGIQMLRKWWWSTTLQVDVWFKSWTVYQTVLINLFVWWGEWVGYTHNVVLGSKCLNINLWTYSLK